MSRPPVSVVMPFAGDRAAAGLAVQALLALRVRPGDELILSDNSGVAPAAPGVTLVRATAEQSPAHARNVGAEHARNEWILFLDADCYAPAGLLDAYFGQPIEEDVGALAGEVIAHPDAGSLAGRYGAARNFLSQRVHLQHPYRPRAVAANLLVRRDTFTAVSGFFEGVRAAEDTDFSWRIQEAGWRLELRRDAWVEHRYRASLTALRRQWRGYAAGRAWLARRYGGFVPQPAAKRGLGRALRRLPGRSAGRARAAAIEPERASQGRLQRGGYLVIDVLLSAEELAGLALSNRPGPRRTSDARVVLVAGRFPQRDDPLAQLALALQEARVEAAARPDAPDLQVSRRLQIDYREDDGWAARGAALTALAVRHPVRSLLDVLRPHRGTPSLVRLAPAVRRLQRDSEARVQALGGDQVHATARRIARLAGRRLEHPQPR